ncbi:F186A-like protein [Mya arenaria]|uniref:F186A-like protein n=1 Tax=Mya arenaria TaxID=6604 RepID=A0ABY7DSK4_MYAAR|nr:F186A-like protein [Mya arenaria]
MGAFDRQHVPESPQTSVFSTTGIHRLTFHSSASSMTGTGNVGNCSQTIKAVDKDDHEVVEETLEVSKVGRYRLLSFGESETASVGSTGNTDEDAASLQSEEADSAYNEWLSDTAELENVILSDDIEQLQKICDEKKIDINIQLNDKGETALILAVKLSKIEMVKTLLLTSNIDRNCLNVQYFSPLDVALVTAFDNRLEPRQTVCWEIIECLLQVDAEPSSKDAMMYIIRTALKYCDEEFIYRLILLAKEFSNSTMLHEIMLQKLHRHQPVYIEKFTIKLLKNANGSRLCDIVNSMIYYLDSYWHCRTNKMTTFQKLILYASAAGWDWTPQQMDYINRVCPYLLSRWCKIQKLYPISLSHLARKSFRLNTQSPVPESLLSLPYRVPDALKDYIMLKDVDEFLDGDEINIKDIRLLNLLAGILDADISPLKAGILDADISPLQTGILDADISPLKAGILDADISPLQTGVLDADISPQAGILDADILPLQTDILPQQTGILQADILLLQAGILDADISPLQAGILDAGILDADISPLKGGILDVDISPLQAGILDADIAPLKAGILDVDISPLQAGILDADILPLMAGILDAGILDADISPLQAGILDADISPRNAGILDAGISPLKAGILDADISPIQAGILDANISPLQAGILEADIMPLKACILDADISPLQAGILDADIMPLKAGILDADISPLQAGILDADISPLQAGILDADISPLQAGILDADIMPLKAGILDADISPLQAGILDADISPLQAGILDDDISPLQAGILDDDISPLQADILDADILPQQTGILQADILLLQTGILCAELPWLPATVSSPVYKGRPNTTIISLTVGLGDGSDRIRTESLLGLGRGDRVLVFVEVPAWGLGERCELSALGWKHGWDFWLERWVLGNTGLSSGVLTRGPRCPVTLVH